MTDITHIPLSQLTVYEGNVRKTGVTDGLGELKASIAAHGLLQPLVVRKHGKKFAVVAGQRRLLALQALAADRTIGKDYEVRCTLIDAKADATEISLAENTVRLQMHPADQFEAFRQLHDAGAVPAEIAARFGVAESTVLKLLKLGRVSPKIINAYRAGELNLEQMQAFASSDDHEQQEAVFEDINPEYTDADQIRDALTPEGDIPDTDKRVLYVGIDAYVKAGGNIRSDLFTETTFLLDLQLLNELAAKKLAKSGKKIRAEGWAWVKVDPDLSWEKKNKYGRIYESPAPLPSELQAEYDALEQEAHKLRDAYYEEDADDAEYPPRLAEIEERIEELDDRECSFHPDEIALAGAFITLDRHGKIEIERGMVKPEDKSRLKALEKAHDDGDEQAAQAALDTPPAPQEKGLSASLMEVLTAHRSAALKASLAVNPDIGLAAAVHAIAGGILYRGNRAGSCLSTHASRQYHSLAKDTPANDELDREESLWRDRIPGDESHFWQWCLNQDRDSLIALLTFCTALSIDATQKKQDKPDCDRLHHAIMLAKALKLDMKAYFQPDAENYFGKISKAMILADLREITGKDPSPAQLKMKKGELAKLAEKLVIGTGWLPAILRNGDIAGEQAKRAA